MPFRPHEGATKSESLIFNLIAHDPALEEYVAMHSLGLAHDSRKSYAECDFVLIGPTGIFCLEVKGGSVTRRGGVWTIGWPGSQYTSAEGPFKQAQAARGALLDEIRRQCGSGLLRRIPVGWGVAFPDITFDRADPECDRQCIFDERDRDEPFSAYLARLSDFTRKHEAYRGRIYPARVSQTDINTIVQTFRADFDLAPRISGQLRDSRQELMSLSAEQYSHLATITHPENPRVICEGSAGTGKTILAAEAARRFASSGQRVLFLCFNRNLAWHLMRQEFAQSARVTIDTVSHLLYHLVRSETPERRLEPDDLNALAVAGEDAALEAVERGMLEPFDVLIVDEAQDVLSGQVMNALDWWLRGGIASGRWAIFLDIGAQAGIYEQLQTDLYRHLSSKATNITLRLNMRNPPAIAKEASGYVATSPPPCRRQLAAYVDYRTIRKTRTVRRTASALLTELMTGGADPQDIALLSFRPPMDAFFTQGFAEIGLSIQVLDGRQKARRKDSSFAASIPAFKGLEADIVVIGDLPDTLAGWHRASLYVALTRARTTAYILCPESFVDYRMSLLGSLLESSE